MKNIWVAYVLSVVLVVFLKWNAFALDEQKHVMLIHVDGLHSDVLRAMLKKDQLPHLQYLNEHGKFNSRVSTVDKSETMKVVLSYLTSHVDVKITGWWQFERMSYKFHNTWIDPMGVVGYATGVDVPAWPTIVDFMHSKKRPTLGGFSLYRRHIDFENFSRNYFDGIMGVFHHKYYDQMHESVNSFIKLYKREIQKKDPLPAISKVVLAPFDEMVHLYGVTTNEVKVPSDENSVIYCVDKKNSNYKKGVHDIVMKFFTQPEMSPYIYVDRIYSHDQIFRKRNGGHFSDLRFSEYGDAESFCYDLPIIETDSDPKQKPVRKVVHPEAALAMILVDIEFGRIMDMMRSVKFASHSASSEAYISHLPFKGLPGILNDQVTKPDNLFFKTLFMIFGDHGMVDSKNMMNACKEDECQKYERSNQSINESFISYLNKNLHLKTASANSKMKEDENFYFGIDDVSQPFEISKPYEIEDWQDDRVRAIVSEGRQKSREIYSKMFDLMEGELSKKYWYMFFLKRFFVFPKFKNMMKDYESDIIDTLLKTWLNGRKIYVEKEKEFLSHFYDGSIRLVYGGAARNNAEIFIPSNNGKSLTWSQRPHFSEILDYRPGGKNKPKLLDVLQKIQGVDLMFIRKNNHEFHCKKSKPKETNILVFNQEGHQGLIYVTQDSETLEKIYGYQKLTDKDPLLFKEVNTSEMTYGTYDEWNDRSLRETQFYHNPVAGIGSYLYSNQDSIGDILVLHQSGWNFGDNAGGHGGIHRQEKLTAMLVSNPSLTQGQLMGKAAYTVIKDQNGKPQVQIQPWNAHPTLLDVAPTALEWLGYPAGSLTDFSRSEEFKQQWLQWIQMQKKDLADNMVQLEDLKKISDFIGFPLPVEAIAGELTEFLDFLPQSLPDHLPDYEREKEEGKVLSLNL